MPWYPIEGPWTEVEEAEFLNLLDRGIPPFRVLGELRRSMKDAVSKVAELYDRNQCTVVEGREWAPLLQDVKEDFGLPDDTPREAVIQHCIEMVAEHHRMNRGRRRNHPWGDWERIAFCGHLFAGRNSHEIAQMHGRSLSSIIMTFGDAFFSERIAIRLRGDK